MLSDQCEHEHLGSKTDTHKNENRHNAERYCTIQDSAKRYMFVLMVVFMCAFS